MLVNFTFQNFRSFRYEQSMRMEATSIRELKDSVVETERITAFYLPL